MTDDLRDALSAIYLGDRETAARLLRAIADGIDQGHDLPTIGLLGPAEMRNPAPDHLRVAI